MKKLIRAGAAALLAVSLVRDRKGINLSIHHQAEQETGATVFSRAPERERVSA